MTNLARVIMGANIAGIYGAQIFRQDDRPRYKRAFSVACAVLAAGLVLAIVRYIDDAVRRRKNKRKPGPESVSNGSDSDSMFQNEKDRKSFIKSLNHGPLAQMAIDDGSKIIASHDAKATS